MCVRKRPRQLIAISGVYGTRMFRGRRRGRRHFHNPLAYLPGLDDPWHVERYRRSQITFITGQGS